MTSYEANDVIKNQFGFNDKVKEQMGESLSKILH